MLKLYMNILVNMLNSMIPNKFYPIVMHLPLTFLQPYVIYLPGRHTVEYHLELGVARYPNGTLDTCLIMKKQH